MTKKKLKPVRRRFGPGSFLAAVAVLAIVLYLAGGVRQYRGSPNAESEVAQSRAALAELQAQARQISLPRSIASAGSGWRHGAASWWTTWRPSSSAYCP